ncbi:Mevalonate kinase [Binucleata daphniae]
MGVIAEKAYKLIQSDFSLDQMHHLIKENHDLLYELGVVPAEMQKEVLRLRAKGIESKITGAGCGGHLFTIVDKNTEIDNWEEIEIYEE